MPIVVATEYFLHVQDFVDAYIGPFATEEAAEEHYRWQKEVRGDGAMKIGISTDLPPFGDMIVTPEHDKSWDPEDPNNRTQMISSR